MPVLYPFSIPCQIITPLIEIAIWMPNPNPNSNPNPSPTPNPKPGNNKKIINLVGINLAGVRIGHNIMMSIMAMDNGPTHAGGGLSPFRN